MKNPLWILVGLGVLVALGLLIALLRAHAARRADVAYHRPLAQSLELTSPAFEHQRQIPSEFSCEGHAGSPPLTWPEVPRGTRSLVLLAVDSDIPSSRVRLMEFVHWVVYDLPAETRSLPSQVSLKELAELGAVMGRNGYGHRQYIAPCPVSGTHRYVYRLYALDVEDLEPKRDHKAGVLWAMEGHILGYGELVGLYHLKSTSGWHAMRRNINQP
jgi:Raf kinase inhibitor-like YbhB/YbcL family protein